MENDDLGKTKPIQKLDDASVSREEKFENIVEEELETREEKYQRLMEEEKNKELEEEAEKALAQKNIELAEEIEEAEKEEAKKEEEKESEEDEEEKKDAKKAGLMVRLKKWWASLDKTQKIIYGILFALFIILFILLLVGLVIFLTKDKGNEEAPKEEPQVIEEEQPPIMFDNYYYKDGALYFTNEGGADIGEPYTCDNKSERLCTVAKNNYRDTLDVPRLEYDNGDDVVENVAIVDENYVFINDTDVENARRIVLYSIKENKRIAEYNDVKAYDGNLYAVSDSNDKYGLIQIKDGVKQLIKPQYSYLGMIDGENYLVAKETKGFIIIDKKDKGISKHVSVDEVKYYNSNFIVAKKDRSYAIYNYKGEELLDYADFATVRGKYIFYILNDEVYVIDNEGNKFNEEGVRLNNSEYLKTYVYNDNKEMIKTKRSFELEVKGDNIAIAVYDNDYDNPQFSNLSILEGKLNSSYKLVSYYDGKLYFYADEEKKYTIGEYECTKKNEITSSSKSYDNCFVAIDTIFEDNDLTTNAIKNRKAYAAIMNNQLVFIKDGDSIFLYNMSTKHKAATYTKINTYSSGAEFQPGMVTGKKDVVAISKKSDMYGVIRVDGENVTGLYPFKYDKIEKLADHFIGLATNGKWVLFVKNQTEGVFPAKPAGYSPDLEHVKTFDGNNYAVYSLDGTEVANGYYYVDLYDDFYAGVDEEKNISIYNYNGEKLSNETLKMNDVPIHKTEKVPFSVEKDGDDYVVALFDGSMYSKSTIHGHHVEPPVEEPGGGE